MNITDRRADLQKRAAGFHNADFQYPDIQAHNKALTAVRLSMGDYIPDNRVRRLVLGWLFVQEGIEISTANLTQGQLETLRKWLVILPNGDGTFSISQLAAKELREMAELFEPELVKEARKMGGEVDAAVQVHPTQPARYFTFEP